MSEPSTLATLTHLPFPTTDPTHFVHIISNLLSLSECNSIIASHTDLSPSNLTYGTIRTREQFFDRPLANRLWSRISKFYAGTRIQDEDGYWWVAKGLNPDLRLSKYEKDGKFTAHFDYPRSLSLNEQTFLSLNIYLNTVPSSLGGSTRILRHEATKGDYWNGIDGLEVLARIQPVQGCASVFRDTVWHDGDKLLGGEKFLLRSDVVFEREEAFDFDKMYEEEEKRERAEKLVEREKFVEADERAREIDPGNGG
ncbi:uncharacterized protein LY89DRAFT_688836 [Mollisia scopiformis]|uniref:Prolyl 4-hydroxylase alpha subunit domain-containing protein n=1 Tax=Mollisia scopiformis TaxID=149040 RepID=A0A194WVF7_MOLSC|nr:uncharacterized protein LY89DRAFT_688836 [Mollisia scopiformis]KUJ11654.1 hypothetical protein LY89DRAFT_688836 [Mollisia scopiformis]